MNERKTLRCLWDTVQDRDGPCQDRKVQAGGLSLHMCLWELGEGNTDKERGGLGALPDLGRVNSGELVTILTTASAPWSTGAAACQRALV